MGVLKGYENIANAIEYRQNIVNPEYFEAFQIQLFNLINEAYCIIKTDEPIDDLPEETTISIALFEALKLITLKKSIPLTITPERHEISDKISLGIEKSISSKRYDIYFENWESKRRIEFGVEAKLLIENNINNKRASTLIHEYISDAGMGKFINRIYEKRGCMIGYIVEGSIANIVLKINQQVSKTLSNEQCLVMENNPQYNASEIYKSKHKGKLEYDLFHLMLDFN
ncbi:MAG TPA: hypothetical protein VIH57_06700 [Bacteroidales bacterium]